MTRRFKAMALPVLLVASCASSMVQADERDEEIERLKAMIAELQQRVEALEADSAVGDEALTGAERADESGTLPLEEATDEGIAFTGAVRYNFSADEDSIDSKRGESGFDLFRVGAEGSVDNFQVSAEYRFYSYMDTIHHGWIGYESPDYGAWQLGVSQVPFGILPYAAHNYWFGVPYYLGLADDYDLGLKYIKAIGNWDLQFAFYKNDELGDPSDLDRIAYDLVTVGEQANEETNQFNARAAYTFGNGVDAVHEVGVSARGGEIYNTITGDTGSHWAAAVHLDSRWRRWNFQLELARYAFDPANPATVNDDTVLVGAFADAYEIAAEGTVGVANVAYNLPIDSGFIDSVLLYNDFSIVHKDLDDAEDSMLNTTGAAIGIGPVFIYIDMIQASNMIYFANGSLAAGGETSWERLFNINVGYYW